MPPCCFGHKNSENMNINSTFISIQWDLEVDLLNGIVRIKVWKNIQTILRHFDSVSHKNSSIYIKTKYTPSLYTVTKKTQLTRSYRYNYDEENQ